MSLPVFMPARAPDAGAENKPEIKILEAEFGGGYTQSAGDGINSIRDVWTLTWEKMKTPDAMAIEAFLRERGGYQAFYYTVPGTGQQLLWTCKEWKLTRLSAGLSGVAATFRRSFNLNR